MPEPAAVFPDVTFAYLAFQRASERHEAAQTEYRAAIRDLQRAQAAADLAADKAAVASDDYVAARLTYKDASNQYD